MELDRSPPIDCRRLPERFALFGVVPGLNQTFWPIPAKSTIFAVRGVAPGERFWHGPGRFEAALLGRAGFPLILLENFTARPLFPVLSPSQANRQRDPTPRAPPHVRSVQLTAGHASYL